MLLFVLQLKGNIDETNSTVEIVDKFNNYQIYPRIISIVSKDYFKFFKVRIFYFDSWRLDLWYIPIYAIR